MKIKAGKSYKLNLPHFGMNVKAHIEYILENPVEHTDNPDEFKLVVYRVWLKHKGYWKHYIEPYYAICIWNDWNYDKTVFNSK